MVQIYFNGSFDFPPVTGRDGLKQTTLGGGGTNCLPNERFGFTEWAERGGSFTSVLPSGVSGGQKFGLVSSYGLSRGHRRI